MNSNLKRLREARKNLLAEFNLRKKQEWTEVSAEIDARIQLEINRLHNSGMKISAIMREYGTSDRRTVTNQLFTSTSNPTPITALLTWTHIEGDNWQVSDGTHLAQFVVLPDEEALVMVNATDSDFGESITFDHFRPQLETKGSL